MPKIMKQEREIVLKAARECYSGENLEKYLTKTTNRNLKAFVKKVQEHFMANLDMWLTTWEKL